MTETTHLDSLGKIYLACESYVVKDGKVLLFRRSSTSRVFPGALIGPGGHIDSTEDAMTAAIREVEEETGIKIGEEDIKLKAVAYHYHKDRGELWISNIYLARINENQETSDGIEEEGKGEWVSIDEALNGEAVFPPSKYYFDHVLNDKPGIMYTNITWENAQLVKVNSQRVDTNS